MLETRAEAKDADQGAFGAAQWKAWAKEYSEDSAQAYKESGEAEDRLKTVYTYGPTVPIVLLLLFPIFTWINRGFRP